MTEPTPDPVLPRRPGTPRWVKAIGLALIAVVLLALVVIVVGGGRHGPGMHAGTGAGRSPSSTAVDPLGREQAVGSRQVALG